MNTKQVQEQLANLKTADVAAYKAGTKSNFVLNYVRNELIKKAFEADKELNKEVKVMFSLTNASYAIGSIAVLTKEGNYPALFDKAVMEMKNGEIEFQYKIKADGLSNDYRARLNEQLNIQLPLMA